MEKSNNFNFEKFIMYLESVFDKMPSLNRTKELK